MYPAVTPSGVSAACITWPYWMLFIAILLELLAVVFLALTRDFRNATTPTPAPSGQSSTQSAALGVAHASAQASIHTSRSASPRASGHDQRPHPAAPKSPA